MNIAFLTPIYHSDVKVWYHDSVLQTQWPTYRDELSHIRRWKTIGRWTPSAMADMVKAALAWKADYIVMASADVGWEPDTISRLIAHCETGKDYVGAWGSGRTPPFLCHVADKYDPEKRLFNIVLHPESRHGLEKVAGVGGELVVWSRRLFEVIPPPWFFGPRMANGDIMMTEDYYLCEQCHEIGIDVWVDWDCPVFHDIDRLVTYKGQFVSWHDDLDRREL